MPLPITLSTVVLDPPTALLAGSVVALVSARLISLQPDRELMRTTAWGAAWGAFYACCVGYMFFTQPDWMLAYLKDAREVSLLPAFLIFAVLCAAFGAFGGAATGALLHLGRRPLAFALTSLAAATVGAIFWLQWSQYFLIGTFEEFYSGNAVPLPQHAQAQMGMNLAGGLTAAGSIALIVLRLVQTKRASADGGQRSRGTEYPPVGRA